jgi:hypothetical protein
MISVSKPFSLVSAVMINLPVGFHSWFDRLLSRENQRGPNKEEKPGNPAVLQHQFQLSLVGP